MNLLVISIIAIVFLGILATNQFTFGEKELKIYKLKADDGKEFKIPYRIFNGTLETIKADTHAGSLVVSIKSEGEGLLEISVPRNLVDSKLGEQDFSLFVLVDGEEIKYTELRKTECSRTLSATFSNGSQEIEVIGTTLEGPPRSEVPIYCIIPSPKGQMEHGALPEDIVCKEGLQLIFKSEDNSPACVKPDTAQKLVGRGWGVLIGSVTQPNIQAFLNSIKVAESNFTINYNITGGRIIGAEFGCSVHTILLSLVTTNEGNITVNIPKALIDSNAPITNEKKIVLCKSPPGTISINDGLLTIFVDNKLAHYTETKSGGTYTNPKTSTDRTIFIPFENGAKKIVMTLLNYP